MKQKSMSTQAAPQLSIRAIALSIVLAIILAAANTYLGLFAGLTIASAIPAAVASMAVLHAFGGGHILENNIVQTGASAARRQFAGPQGGLSGRRHALAPAGDARHRRVFLRAGDGASAESFVESVRHWRADAGSPKPIARAAGHADGVGVKRSFRRTI